MAVDNPQLQDQQDKHPEPQPMKGIVPASNVQTPSNQLLPPVQPQAPEPDQMTKNALSQAVTTQQTRQLAQLNIQQTQVQLQVTTQLDTAPNRIHTEQQRLPPSVQEIMPTQVHDQMQSFPVTLQQPEQPLLQGVRQTDHSAGQTNREAAHQLET